MAQDTSTSIIKGFKVTNGLRKRLIGVACSSLEELKKKGCQKLKMETDVKKVDALLSDGTVVEDEVYFQTLPSQTVLILKKPGDKVLRGVDIVYAALKSFNVDLLQTATQVRNFFEHDDVQHKIRTLSRLLDEEKEAQSANLSRRSDDPQWFEDLETNAETKEAYMRKRSSGRVQRYFYDAREKVKHSLLYSDQMAARTRLDSIFNEFYSRLQKNEFFAHFFDRSRSQQDAICDERGRFVCQGLWNSDKCSYVAEDGKSAEHTINPYSSKEQRVIFTTWNLDHRIERSRSIVPSILEACQICCQDKRYEMNSSYFYDLLFTLKNLKLVHIVCHDKNEHKSAICDYKQIVVKQDDRTNSVNSRTKRYKPLVNENGAQVQLKRPKRALKLLH